MEFLSKEKTIHLIKGIKSLKLRETGMRDNLSLKEEFEEERMITESAISLDHYLLLGGDQIWDHHRIEGFISLRLTPHSKALIIESCITVTKLFEDSKQLTINELLNILSEKV